MQRARNKGAGVAEFILNGIILNIPDSLLNPQLERYFRSGRYEHSEAEALGRHLRPRDRLLDLGSGAGYLVSIGGRLLAPGAAAGVEANPEMAEVARANLARNQVQAELLWGAVVTDDHPQDQVSLTVRPAFWASSLEAAPEGGSGRAIKVPALRFGSLMERFQPTVISVDIEGGELGLFDRPLPPCVRLVMLELHPAVYRRGGVKRIFDGLSATGLTYCPVGSASRTVVFERVS